VGCPQGERSESIPPSPPSFEEELACKCGLFFHISRMRRGDENPRPGFDNGQLPVGQMTSLRGICPQGERSESIPPPHRHHLKKSSHANAGFFFTYRAGALMLEFMLHGKKA